MVLDAPVSEAVTVNVSTEGSTIPSGVITVPATVEFEPGSSEAQIECRIDGTNDGWDKGVAYSLKLTLTTDSKAIKIGQSVYNAVVIRELEKLELGEGENVTSPFDASSYDGDGIAGLIDNNSGTFFCSAWSGEDLSSYDCANWGVWIDVTLPEAVRYVRFVFQQRGGENGNNGNVVEYVIGAGTEDGELQKIVPAERLADDVQQPGAWGGTVVGACPEGTKKVRFGVTKSNSKGQEKDLTTNPLSSMSLAKLEVWVVK